MKILHITPHLGGGVGTVIMDWMVKIKGKDSAVLCLDTMNDKGRDVLGAIKMAHGWNQIHELGSLKQFIGEVDIVLVHYWDHPMLADLFAGPIPDCRMVFWCHKNIAYPPKVISYPDLWIDTSPIQGHGKYIWSTGNMERFLAIEPKPHKGFNIGTVCSKKLHPKWYFLCQNIGDHIPNAHFTLIGERKEAFYDWDSRFTFTGKVDDVAPYLAEMDVFAYPLRPDHYGTCEIALGEAMAAGVIPVVMNNLAELEIVNDRWNGFVACDEHAYINIIEYLYGWNGDLVISKNEMLENIRIQAKKIYSIDHMIASWEQVFQEMMQKPKTRKEALK